MKKGSLYFVTYSEVKWRHNFMLKTAVSNQKLQLPGVGGIILSLE